MTNCKPVTQIELTETEQSTMTTPATETIPTRNQIIPMTKAYAANKIEITESLKAIRPMSIMDYVTQTEDLAQCFSIADRRIQLGNPTVWRQLDVESDHVVYKRQGAVCIDSVEDALWLRDLNIQESVTSNSLMIQEYRTTTAALPTWQNTRWVFISVGNDKYILIDTKTGQRCEPNCPEASALLKCIEQRQKEAA